MADQNSGRNYVGKVDPAARKKFQDELKRLGRPVVKRATAAKPAAKPFMSVIQRINQSMDQIAADVTGRRTDPAALAVDASGIGARRRQGVIDANVDAAVNGTPPKKKK